MTTTHATERHLPVSGQQGSKSRAAGARSARALLAHGWPVALLVLLAYLVLSPLVRLQALAVDDGAAGYDRALASANLSRTIWTTVALGLGSLTIAMGLGIVLAWYSTRLPPRASWLAMLPMLPIVLPPVASVIGWAMLLSPKSGILNRLMRELPWWRPDATELPSGPVDVFSPLWIVIVTGLSLTSFVYVFLRSGMARLNAELLEASRLAGAGQFRTFVSVVLPMIRPSLIYGGAVALLLGLGQFTAPLLLGTQQNVRVITTEVYRFASLPPTDYAAAAAMASPLLVVGLLVVALQRVLLSNGQRFVSDVGKGTRTASRPSRASVGVIAGYGLFATFLPIGALVVASLSPFWTGKVEPSQWTTASFEKILDDPRLVDGIQTSVIVSVVAVAILIPIGYLIAELIHRERGGRVVRGAVDLLITLPLGVPAVVFGAGFLFTYTEKPLVLYGTKWVLIVVYVTLMVPYTVRLQLAARMAMGDAYEAAARVSGAGAVRAHLGILMPMMRGAIGGAAALIFVLLSHEFAASLLVRSTRTQVLGTVFYDYWTTSSYPVVAAIGLVMCAITALGVGLALRIGGSSNTLERL